MSLSNQSECADLDFLKDDAARFIKNFYIAFDKETLSISKYYHDQSVYRVNGRDFIGTQDIVGQLKTVVPIWAAHDVLTVDVKIPSEGDVLYNDWAEVFVAGNIIADGMEVPFLETFNLHYQSDRYWICHDYLQVYDYWRY